MKLISEIKTFFSINLLWKGFSLFVAIVLWFLVMNIINPTETKTFIVELSLLNESKLTDNGLSLVNKEQLEGAKIEIKVQASRPALDELSKADNRAKIKANIDLQKYEASVESVGVMNYNAIITPELPKELYLNSYKIISCTPNGIEIKIDKIESVSKSITAECIGIPKAGYIVKTPLVEIENVLVKGLSEKLSEISYVKVVVDITGASDDISLSVEPKAYDVNGLEIKQLIIEPSLVEVRAVIDKQGQIAVNQPKTTGVISNDLILKNIEWSPKFIEVEGDAQELLRVDTIKLPDIDLSDIVTTTTKTFDVRPYLVNTNLKLKSGTPTDIKVVINVEQKISKDIQIPANKLVLAGLQEGLRAQIPGVIMVSVRGSQDAVNALDVNNIKASVNLLSLGEGWHNVVVDLALPSGVESANTPTVYIMLRNKQDASVVETTIAPASELATETTIETSGVSSD